MPFGDQAHVLSRRLITAHPSAPAAPPVHSLHRTLKKIISGPDEELSSRRLPRLKARLRCGGAARDIQRCARVMPSVPAN